MNITVAFADTDTVLAVEVASDMTINDFRAYVQEEAGFKSNPSAPLFYNNQQLRDSETLEQAGITDNGMVVVSSGDAGAPGLPPSPARPAETGTASVAAGGASVNPGGVPNDEAMDLQIEAARQQILYEPALFAQLSQQSPGLAEALHDPSAFRKAYRRLYEQQLQPKAENEEIDRNFRMAMEEMPEAFATVTMLFANIEVNGVPVKAFVDSGAQTTIMSPECAERCHLSHLIDRRHRGMAYGVGQAKILGRIHMAPIKIGGSYFACSMTVIDGTNMEFLLGLDMLKHHQATIDLKDNKLRMGHEELAFLDESEIPRDLNGVPPASAESAVTAKPRGSQPAGVGPSESSVRAGPASSAFIPPPAALPTPALNNSLLRPSIVPGLPIPTGPAPEQRPGQAAGEVPGGPPQQPPPGRAGLPFDPAIVANLVSLGFSQSQVLDALRRADGNADVAAAMLFGD